MTKSEKEYVRLSLRNRLLNSVFKRSVEVKKGFSNPFTDKEVRSCKLSLKLIMRAHFKLADLVLKSHCPEMWQCVFE